MFLINTEPISISYKEISKDEIELFRVLSSFEVSKLFQLLLNSVSDNKPAYWSVKLLAQTSGISLVKLYDLLFVLTRTRVLRKKKFRVKSIEGKRLVDCYKLEARNYIIDLVDQISLSEENTINIIFDGDLQSGKLSTNLHLFEMLAQRALWHFIAKFKSTESYMTEKSIFEPKKGKRVKRSSFYSKVKNENNVLPNQFRIFRTLNETDIVAPAFVFGTKGKRGGKPKFYNLIASRIRISFIPNSVLKLDSILIDDEHVVIAVKHERKIRSL